MIQSEVDFKDVSHIYDFLIEGIISKNNSVIPSRSERRIDGVRWSTAWKNLHGVRGLSAEEYVFAWNAAARYTSDRIKAAQAKR